MLAAFLLICFGILVPTAGASVRVCLMEGATMGGGPTSFGKTSSVKPKCCEDDCGTQDHEECCADLKQLPDSTLPVLSVALPALVGVDLPLLVFVPPAIPVVEKNVFQPSVPIRGPDSPAAHRALLGIWRI